MPLDPPIADEGGLAWLAAAERMRRSVQPPGGRQEGGLTKVLSEYVPHVLGGMASLPQRAFEASDRLRYAGEYDPGPGLEAALLTMGGTGFAARRGALGAGPGIRAYHGSPYSFERFDINKIGTGEGAQAYGHGLYFAEHEPVALDYRNRLTVGRGTMDQTALTYLNKAGGDKIEAKRLLQEALGQQLPTTHPVMEAIDRFNTGHMYEVNIRAQPGQLLDWDKVLSPQQREVFAQAIPRRAGYFRNEMSAPSGQSAYEELAGNYAGQPRASAALREAGIPGIQYLDQLSRAAGQGSRNYVVFDPGLIDILRKYGLAGIPAGAAVGAAVSDQSPQ